ncbi:hypothetical protein J437_LFUL009129 [Ladona fulva]|uniref:Uncharacterized protein n=1 Tax=Ladona fulva TaxID=123851 RepID=A0A8K0K7F9_LADFU|nr:hypothetical protein J437_LFUL009129 [Ladona fulva]
MAFCFNSSFKLQWLLSYYLELYIVVMCNYNSDTSNMGEDDDLFNTSICSSSTMERLFLFVGIIYSPVKVSLSDTFLKTCDPQGELLNQRE